MRDGGLLREIGRDWLEGLQAAIRLPVIGFVLAVLLVPILLAVLVVLSPFAAAEQAIRRGRA